MPKKPKKATGKIVRRMRQKLNETLAAAPIDTYDEKPIATQAEPVVEETPEPPPVSRYSVVALHVSSEKSNAPVSGKSFYIVLGREKTNYILFHPFSFTKFTMAIPEFHISLAVNDWDPSPEKLLEFLQKKIASEASLKREIPLYVQDIVKHFESIKA